MSLKITPELEAMVRDLYLSGDYANESEILHEALTLLDSRNRLRREIFRGLAELDRGERIDGDEVFRSLEGKYSGLKGL
jgi:Arc/MetJ-type ribon-helix-helix transcriptional regulator